ncbi:hypothetical protein DDW09_05140 [Sulfolobus sp. SCGC AB-777_L09]|jgi:predicted nucleic acid-binding protein|nr:hypothetical protein [Sulfolobaceae archaeon]PVU69103.1 hypothetical protein DDW09_05140 [Sulfolobus sp. SCGC AB-777_L09]
MSKYIVVSSELVPYIDKIVKAYSDRKVVITTLTFSKVLKKGVVNPSHLLDQNVWIRAYSHKPVKIGGLDEADSESVLVAQELSAELLTNDEKIEKVAKELGITVLHFL